MLDRPIPLEVEPPRCVVCGDGPARLTPEYADVTYRGASRKLPTYYRQCNHCDSSYYGLAESILTKAAMDAFKVAVDAQIASRAAVFLVVPDSI